MESNCCGALPIGETCDNLGCCSACKEHAVFKEEEDNERARFEATWINHVFDYLKSKGIKLNVNMGAK